PRTYRELFDYLIAEVGVVAAAFEERLAKQVPPSQQEVAPAVQAPQPSPRAASPVKVPASMVRPVEHKVLMPDLVIQVNERREQAVPARESEDVQTEEATKKQQKLPQNFIRGRQGLVYATD